MGYLILMLSGIVIAVSLMVGYIFNIIALVTVCDFEAPYKCEAVRIVGIPMAPVGGVVGWMDIGE